MVSKCKHTLIDNRIVFDHSPANELIVRIWALAHSDPLCGHFGALRTVQAVKSVIEWPGMDHCLNDLTAACATCQKLRGRILSPGEICSTRASKPFESVFIDYVGPFRANSDGSAYVLTIIDRFSHYVVLTATPDTTADTTITILWNRWICVFGAMELLTSDGGSSFNNTKMKDICKLLGTTHHISASGHPEGHGAVERVNHVVTQILRAKFAHRIGWSSLVQPTAFAINTAVCRSIGTTPFAVVHGFPPRLPIHAALGVSPGGDDEEPLAFADTLVSSAQTMFAEVRQLEEKAYKKSLERIKKTAQKPGAYAVGDMVLVHRKRPEKLLLCWKGPFEIVEVESGYMYVLKNLLTDEKFRCHANSMRRFIVGTMTKEQLLFEATEQDEYIVEKVHEHYQDNGRTFFYVKWLGWDQQSRDTDDAWPEYRDVRFSPVIREYCGKYNLKPSLHH